MITKPGKWLDTTAQHEDTLQGQTEEILVLRAHPPTGAASSSRLHPARVQHQQLGVGCQKQLDQVAHLLPPNPSILKAFKPAFAGEPASSIEARLRTMDDTWAAFEARIRVGRTIHHVPAMI